MTTPEFRAGPPIGPDAYREWIHRAVFDCCKWSVSSGDIPTLCRYPLLIRRSAWARIALIAESLAAEAEDAERELIGRPDLHESLGLPRKTRAALARARFSPGPRYVRFDFHPTPEGLRISEGNCDVSGGVHEASELTRWLAAHLGLPPPGDPSRELARALSRRFGKAALVGLLHLSMYAEDREVVTCLARRMEEEGLKAVLVDGRQLRPSLRARVEGREMELDALFRFFPADWLERLEDDTGWPELFGSPAVCNPVTTILTQSKRFPLLWTRLRSSCDSWKAHLPEAREPTGKPLGAGWVYKPALGHEGFGVSIEGVTPPESMARVLKEVRRSPEEWVAQRRFEFLPIDTPDGPRYACLGVHIVDGSAAGAYARVSERPIIDDKAQEAVVLMENR